MDKKLSSKLEDILFEIEKQIISYIKENTFYLNFDNKNWSSCSQGKALVCLTILAVNLRHDIDILKQNGL